MFFFFPFSGGLGGFLIFILFILISRLIRGRRDRNNSENSGNSYYYRFTNDSNNSGYNYGYGRSQGGASRLADAYKALGVSETADESEIKKAYRKLILEFHPDTVNSRSELSEESKKYAARRFREVQEAYELICKERGIK